VLNLDEYSAKQIFGSIDEIKFRYSMTLFNAAMNEQNKETTVESIKCYNTSMTDTERLLALSKADPGFYILAIHAYIEKTIKIKYPGIETEVFWRMMDDYKSILINKASPSHRELEFIYSLKREHNLTNRVRHQFEAVSRTEARGSTWNFLRFLKMEGIAGSVNTAKIRKLLQDWDKRTVFFDKDEFIDLKYQLIKLNTEHENFLARYEQYKESAELVQLYENQIYDLKAGTGLLNIQIKKKDERVESLRQERLVLQNKLIEIEKQRQEQLIVKGEFGSFDKYLDALERLSSISRSRTDFERDVLKTTPEQQKFIDEIDFTKDILVKGSAGTGKSLVLLKSLEKALWLQSEKKDLSGKKRIRLLTYTNTLTKYNAYLSEVMKIENSEEIVTTALGFLENKLQEIEEGSVLDFTLWITWRKQFCPAFMDQFDFQNEVENFLWSMDISKEEYLDEFISRKGMGKALRREHREELWQAKLRVESMLGPGYTRSSAAVRLKRYLENAANDDPLKDLDYLFVDESQDMLPVELNVLKKLTTHAVILAGDTDQSIYQARSPYSRAGYRLRGNTRILHTNFRNTIPIHNFAEVFRDKTKGKFSEHSEKAAAFREGPIPEIYTPIQGRHLSEMLIQKVKVFIEEINYAPENIAILIPSFKVRNRIEEGLKKAGYSSVWIKEDDFDFRQTGVIRLCPIHSSKGLDFPVVMLYLPFMFPSRNDEDEKKQKNLLYVACTRAMDNLNIFVDPGKSQVLQDLIDSMESKSIESVIQ
jgi:AAA domain-containing protein/UvrD-like helicase family protein/uncharacterized protein DUF1810